MTMLTEALSAREDHTEEMRTNVRRLEETLKSFGVDVKIENVVRGPTVTRYEMELKPGVKMNKITSLHEDIALALGVSGIRVAAVQGKSSIIGIEVPNKITTSVPIREVLSSKEFQHHKSNLAFAVGKDIGGNYIIGDIAKMPHLLIAGTTGSGKSVCMNSIIVSLLYRASPEQVRLIMIDPKVVELSIYNGIPHLLIPVVTDAKKAAGALQWAVTEMERRYKLLADYKVRDLSGYNKLAKVNEDMPPMPQIVIIIDELADLMLVAAKEVENSIVRIAQKARAAGMYLVIATQRPSSDVITGLMKANIPSRIAFAVASAIDSRIILDESGAEKLVGKGDMLYGPLGGGKPKRVQGCFITDEEVEEVAEFVKRTSDTDYSQEILDEIDQNVVTTGKSDAEPAQTSLEGEGDELLPDAVEVILDTKQASVSMLQRRLKLGYAHAARIVDEMEEKGIVGPFEGSKPRQLLITREQWDTMVGINPKAKVPEESAMEPDPQEDEPPFALD
jgi:S-DNA-T family DNA segregation ATPase FtsK/SpoIIIE